jgi:lipoate-protein ligase A
VTDSWFHLDSGRVAAADNMAWDSALLEFAVSTGRPVLRFYGWTQPAATFGYSQRHAAVADMTSLRPLIRRPTGGGLVPHDRDWTYSVAVPPGHFWYELSAVDSYQRMHEWLRQSFARLTVTTELAPCCDPAGPGRCFVGAEKFDLLLDGRKIAGAAQRRNKLGLLIQGSVQPPPQRVSRSAWQDAMLAAAADSWDVTWSALPMNADLNQRVRELVDEVYARPEHNQRR